MPALDLGDVALHYEVTGETGPLVVQLHGLMSSRSRDAQLGLDLGRALRDHRILRYDARGHGASSGSDLPAAYAWDHLAEDLLALLDHVAADERVHGVGTSMGAGTLLHAASRDPGRFVSLALVAPPTAWDTRRAQSANYVARAELVEKEGLSAFIEVDSTVPSPPVLADAPATAPSVSEQLLPTILRGAALTDLPTAEVLATVRVPTLVLAWRGDPAHPLSTAALLAEVLPRSRLVVASTPHGVTAWPDLFAEHITRVSVGC